MKILLATHYGMCFGVRDALALTERTAAEQPVTVLGQLVHNPVVSDRLRVLGAQTADLETTESPTQRVVITAHGAADRHRTAWAAAGFEVTDTTCPLVRRAHLALAKLVAGGWHPVVIGQAGHVEVRGLTGDFPEAIVVETERDTEALRGFRKLGIVSQTTQPHDRVLGIVELIRSRFPDSEVRFVDTVCQPTRRRQRAVRDLAPQCDALLVIGGNNSNNTRQLVETSRALAPHASIHQIERADDLHPEWLAEAHVVGVTAGTSTLEETVREVISRLQSLGGELVSTDEQP